MTTLKQMMDKLPEERRQKVEERALQLIAEEKERRLSQQSTISYVEGELLPEENVRGAEASLV